MPDAAASLFAFTLAPAQLGALLFSACFLALLIDRLFGEPPVRIHPVVGMGNYLNWAAPRFAPASPSADAKTAKNIQRLGFLYWLLGAVLVLLISCAAQAACIWLALHYGWAWAALPLALLFKPLFAWRMLAAEVQAVENALQDSLDAGRLRLSYLVSRDTQHLSAAQVREAAIETLAENFNDSFIAPLFYFFLGGLPAAALYRYANTADASWGYMGQRSTYFWRDAGRFAARADDVLSYLPARLTALLFLIATQAGLTAQNIKNTLKNAPLTPSPNSGWPMAAMAVLLGLRLGKDGVYQLNPQGRDPTAVDVQAALLLCRRVWLGMGLGLVCGVLATLTYLFSCSPLLLSTLGLYFS